MVAAISQQPVDSKKPGLPEKRTFGSDYPFRNVGQLSGITASANTTASFVSAVMEGFSAAWGAQLMPYTASAFESWPVSAGAMRPHYEAILVRSRSPAKRMILPAASR